MQCTRPKSTLFAPPVRVYLPRAADPASGPEVTMKDHPLARMTSNRRRRGAALGALCVALALLASACSGDETDTGASSLAAGSAGEDAQGDVTEGQDTQSEAPGTTVEADNVKVGTRVNLEGVVLPDGLVEVKVWLRSFADLYGVAAHLRFDPKGLKLKYVQGEEILAGMGFAGRTVLAESPSGRLLMGGARFRIETVPWDGPEGTSVGQQLWATLRFEVLTGGAHVVAFDADHSFAKDSKFKDVPASWGSLKITHVVEVTP